LFQQSSICQIQHGQKKTFKRENQIRIPWNAAKTAGFVKEQCFRFLQGSELRVCRVEHRELTRRIVAATSSRCADSGERGSSPAICDYPKCAAGKGRELCLLENRDQLFD
jgi:hypothetical protein